jgi:aminoglycoside phosphotransferase (APT) family kinase protein
MAQWHPDIELDEATILAAIEEQFPELEAGIHGIELGGAGWDNIIWRVRGPAEGPAQSAFRFVHRHIGVELMQREIDFLPRLAPLVPLAIPVPTRIGRITKDVPLPWFGFEYMGGDEVAAVALTSAARERLGTQLGGFLRALHDPAVLDAVDPDRTFAYDGNRRREIARIGDVTRGLLEALEIDAPRRAAFDAMLEQACTYEVPSDEVFVHGDMHMRQILVDATGNVTGVLDWGDACRGPYFLDLLPYWSLLDEPGQRAFRDAYGPIDDASLACSRIVAVYVTSFLAQSSGDVGRHDVAAGALASIRRVLSSAG